MRLLYSFLLWIFQALLYVLQFFSPKFKKFVTGRNNLFETLSPLKDDKNTIWFHCASLGEYEQGVPIMKALKSTYPECQLLVTFFSPSGYDVKKNDALPDVVSYLPLDMPSKVKRFLDSVKPDLAIFVKYEVWPNFLRELDHRKIPTLLVSAVFRRNQHFFKPYGGFMKRALYCFDHIFVQDKSSHELLEENGFSAISISGDTRFDRVSQQLEIDNRLDFMELLAQDRLCVVCGSTWQEDEEVLIPYINSAHKNVFFVIAPHQIEKSKVASLQQKINGNTQLYSSFSEATAMDTQVLIVDTVGLLTKIYSYADIAYVGGAMGSTGLHNILEPATFGVPIIIGKNFEKFPEARKLQQLAGLFSIASAEEFSRLINRMLEDSSFREKTGMITGHYITSNIGATRKLMEYISKSYGNRLVQIPSKGK